MSNPLHRREFMRRSAAISMLATAYQNGADFICAGMFDFQIAEDVECARAGLEKSRQRSRPWNG